MYVMNIKQADFTPAFGIDMAKAYYNTNDSNQPHIAWGTIPVNGATTPHRHDEVESFIILDGVGEVITDKETRKVSTGDVILFQPFESHILKNSGDDILYFVDLVWRDIIQRESIHDNAIKSRLKERPIFIFSTPPTPNGDLHLGHLSGPYLGADILTRFLKINGYDAYHLTGSDDYQSYVVAKARQEKSTPQTVASHYSNAIKKALELMDIEIDQYTVPTNDSYYSVGLQKFFSLLVEHGLQQRNGEALFDFNNDYLYEVDVSGNCPTCNSVSNGNICEACGEPNTCVDLVNPAEKLSNTVPKKGYIQRYSLDISEFRDVVLDHHKIAKITPKLQGLTERILSRREFHLPVTHPSIWGVPPAEKVAGKQVIWVWVEMAYGFLYGIGKLGESINRKWSFEQPDPNWKIIHFFGYDNSFYHSILFPILYNIAFPEWKCDIDYNYNEFYLLDSLKFSTSRHHAIWGKDILTHDNVDAVRYYLALTRGEQEQSNFSLGDFYNCVNEILINKWQYWLHDLGNRMQNLFENIAPDTGSWTLHHFGFFRTLINRFSIVCNFYEPEAFSLNQIVVELNNIVNDVIKFSKSNADIQNNKNLFCEYRTAVSLELATALLLAQVTYPLMPRFSNKLYNALGFKERTSWSDHVEFVPVGSAITLSKIFFFNPM